MIFLKLYSAHSWIKNTPLFYARSVNPFAYVLASHIAREKKPLQQTQQAGRRMTRFPVGEISPHGACSPNDVSPLENTVP